MAFLAESWPLWLCLVIYTGLLYVAVTYANIERPVFSRATCRPVLVKYIASIILMIAGLVMTALGYGAT